MAADFSSIENQGKPKSFWKRPEGVTGTVVLVGLLGLAGWLIVSNIAALAAFASSALGLAVTLLALGAIIYMVLDPKVRTLVGYAYKSFMRWITGIFVTIDPIGILKNYVEDLQDNLSKMSKQIGSLRGQMRKLKDIMKSNDKEIEDNLRLAKVARDKSNQKAMALSSRKAARLKESNAKYTALLSKMEVLHRVLTKMYENSEVLLEDTKDQVKVKEQERKAIRTSHSAMKSAMNIISGNTDQRMMFDQAMEAIADDVSNKIGEMEQFMDMSSNFMDSIDLQNGMFEEQGMKMLEEWEKKSSLLLLGDGQTTDDTLDLSSPTRQKSTIKKGAGSGSEYDNLFE